MNQPIYRFLEQSVGAVGPAADFSGGLDGVGGGAPEFVAGLLKFAAGEFVVHEIPEMPAAVTVVGDEVGGGVNRYGDHNASLG